jgi:hypothetical protein
MQILRIRIKKVIPLLSLILLCSCDGYYDYDGYVLSKETLTPLDSVHVIFSCYDTVVTDSNGYFKLQTIIPGPAVDKDLLFIKEGYINSVSYSSEKDTIYLQKQDGLDRTVDLSEKTKKNIYRIDLLIVGVLNIMTLIMIFLLKKIRRKFIWTVAILFTTVEFKYSLLNNSFSFIHLKFIIPLKITCFGTFISVFVPFGTLLFWGIYFFSQKWTIKH